MEQFYFTVNLELLLWAASFVSLFVFSLLFLTYRHRSQFTGDNLPPGNVGYPVIGESYEFKSGGWKGHPESFILGRIKKYSSEVFKSSIFGDRVIFFCGAACNKLIFTKETKLVTVAWISSIAKIFPSIMESSSSAESMNLRKMFPIFMKPQSLHGHIGVMDIIAQKHFAENWENNKEVHVFPLTKTYTFTLAARLFVSLEDPKDIEKLSTPFDLVNTGIISMPIDLPGTPFNKAIKASNSIRDELHKIIKQRKIDLAEGKASTTQDILSHMLMVCDDNGMHLKELDIADKILGLLIAGYETASGACTFIVKYLGELLHIYDVVYKEQMEIANSKAPGELLNWDDIQKMKYSWNVAQEVLRMVPPLQGAFRVALTDFTFNGFKIPKGWKLYWSPNSTHKNSTYFPEPEKFDPSRFEGTGPAPYTFVPFGGGSRGCPGKDYARLEILVFMHNLVKRFKWENIILDEKMIVDPMPTPAKGLPVRLFPHRSV